jgi:thioredoxin 1
MRIATTAALALLLAGCSSGKDPEAGPTARDSDVATLTDENFEAAVLRSNRPVLVDFWAAWCRPCLDMKPAVRAAAAEFRGRLVVGELDVEANAFTAEKFGVETLPALVLFRDGEAVRRFDGPQTRESLAREIEPLLDAPANGD